MNSKGDENRGRLLLKEKKMSGRKIAALAVPIFTTYSIIVYLALCPHHCFMFLFLFLIQFAFVRIVMARPYPFAVYENGFDRPLDIKRTLKGEKRFIPFSDVKKIWPYYDRHSPSTIGVSGYIIETVDDRRIGLIDTLNGPELYEAGLRAGLGKKFDMLYDPEPPHLLSVQDRVRKCVSRRKKWPLILAYAASGLMVPFLILMPLLWEHPFVFIIFLASALIGAALAPIAVVGDTVCRKYYHFIARFRPDVADSIRSETGVSTDYEEAREFGEKDWRRLQNILSLNPFIPMGAGILIFSLSMGDFIPGELSHYLLYIGLATMFLAYPIILLTQSKVDFLTRVIDEERRTGEKIIPDDFRIPRWIQFMLPYLRPPEFSERRWKRIADDALPMDEESLILHMILITAFLLLGLIVPALLSHMGFRGPLNFLIFLSFVIFPLIWYRMKLNCRNIARKLLIYEKETGEKVIPDRYRKRIEYAFYGVYRR